MKICIGQKGKEKKKTDLSCFVVLGARSGSLSRKHLTEPFLESAGTQGQGVRGLCCPGGAGCCLGCALVKSGRESADLLCLVPESGLCTTGFPEPLSGQLENCLFFFFFNFYFCCPPNSISRDIAAAHKAQTKQTGKSKNENNNTPKQSRTQARALPAQPPVRGNPPFLLCLRSKPDPPAAPSEHRVCRL